LRSVKQYLTKTALRKNAEGKNAEVFPEITAAVDERQILGWRIEKRHWKRGEVVLVGVDEAGRGPLAGPVVAAAVTFDQNCCKRFPIALHELNDSKLLDAETRDKLFDLIQEHADAVGIGIVEAPEIDAINILQATMRAMTIAVEQLAERLLVKERVPECLLVDGNYFRTTLRYPFETIVGGDGKSPHIAAASVIAKVTRDRIMTALHERYPQYNFSQHKGYGTPAHCAAIREFGMSEVHRKSFKAKSLQDLWPEEVHAEIPEEVLFTINQNSQ
jgi:ribonuclease HII